MFDYEACRKSLEQFVKDYDAGLTRNEATTRLQLIDRLFLDCLAWSRDDFVAEPHYAGEYADYVASAPRPLLIVEAKKEGNYFELPAGSTGVEYSIPGIVRDNPNLGDALKQVARYCQERGIPLAAVCNGHQLVCFVAVRTDSPPLEGRALVFPNLAFMLDHFKDLWDGVSKAGIEEKKMPSRLLARPLPVLPVKLSGAIHDYPGTKGRNTFQTDLKIVSELVLEDLVNVRDLEVEFLKDCYCESGALSDFSLISRHILEARYEALFDEGSPGPTTEPASTKRGISQELLAQGLSRRPILILGDVGVGKTTFIRHLVKVAAVEVFNKAVSLHLNLGSKAALSSDLKQFVLSDIHRQLSDDHGIEIDDASLVRGVYHLDLQKFARGIYGGLRDSAPDEFAVKELQFLESKLAERSEHVRRTLLHLERGRKKQIVIFLDNADQRDYRTQQDAFLIAQEIAANWPATVFLTLRPETFHLSMKSGGTLSGYHPKAFTVAPPRIDRVIEKRLRFGLRITRGQIPLESHAHLRVQFTNLDAIITTMLNTLSSRREISELIDNMAGGNVRLALDLVQSFFGSGHVNTQKIVEIQRQSSGYLIPLHEFLRAVIYGDTVHYDPTRSYVANLYDVSTFDPKEHFLMPIGLSVLATWTGSGIQNGFVETGAFYERMQGMGYTAEQVDHLLVRAYRHKLIEMSGRRTPEPGSDMPPSLRATTDGVYHAEKLACLFNYVDAIIVDVPIFDPKVRENLRDTQDIEERLSRAETFCRYLDEAWLLMNESAGPFSWPNTSRAIRSEINRVRTKTGGR